MHICVTPAQWVNSLWPSDFIWQHRYGSTMAHVMAWCPYSSCNDLLPDGTKPLHEPMLTNHEWGLVAFPWGQFYRNRSRNLFVIWFWKCFYLRLQLHLPGASELTFIWHYPDNILHSWYVMVSFLLISHKLHPIAHPKGWGMGVFSQFEIWTNF